MKTHRDISSLRTTVSFEAYEMANIAECMPEAIGWAVAQKFVEENWDELKKDKAFMAEVRERVIKLSAEKTAALIEEKISKSLGVKE